MTKRPLDSVTDLYLLIRSWTRINLRQMLG